VKEKNKKGASARTVKGVRRWLAQDDGSRRYLNAVDASKETPEAGKRKLSETLCRDPRRTVMERAAKGPSIRTSSKKKRGGFKKGSARSKKSQMGGKHSSGGGEKRENSTRIPAVHKKNQKKGEKSLALGQGCLSAERKLRKRPWNKWEGKKEGK